MSGMSVIVILVNILFCVYGYEIKIEDDGPVVTGGTIHFYATVYNNGYLATDSFKFEWDDDAIPQHIKKTDEINSPNDTWTVTYTAGIYPAGPYIAQVTVMKCVLIICYQVGSARIEFDITGSLNGEMILLQDNRTLSNTFVSTKGEVKQVVQLKQSDMDYIKTAPTVRTYWFIDCTYYGITSQLEFPFNYTVADEDHLVEALVMADFTPLPTTTVPPTTTTAKSTTTTRTPNVTTAITTTMKPNNSQPIITSKTVPKVKRQILDPSIVPQSASNIKVWSNGSLVPYNNSFPYVCNSSYISADSQKTFGYFYRKFITKDPISKVSVTGNNWLQPGDMLALKIQCNGSKNFKFCVRYKRGEYNVTGNEACDIYLPLDTCNFTVRRFLTSPKTTIVVIIENDVSKQVTPATVNIYEVKKQSQLSVIVVPVSFSLVAVVLIVFGVAYYFQNRSRFVIEVADFNFGQQYSDMEYKTFKDRLRDSISNAFTRTPTPSSSEVPVWPPGRKYGSMT